MVRNKELRTAYNGIRAVRNMSANFAENIADTVENIADTMEKTTKAVIQETAELGTKAGAALVSLSTGLLQDKLRVATRKIRRILFGTIITFCAYIGLGALFFWYAEGWLYSDAVYFAIVTVSTVGYGDMTLQLWYSKLFNSFYMFFGCVIIFTNFSNLLINLEAAAVSKAQLALSKGMSQFLGVTMEHNARSGPPRSALLFYLGNGLPRVLIMLGLQAALATPYLFVKMDFPEVLGDNGALQEEATQQYIHYGHALYFSWITALR